MSKNVSDFSVGDSLKITTENGNTFVLKVSEIGEPGIVHLENEELVGTADFSKGYLDYEGKQDIVVASVEHGYVLSLAEQLLEKLNGYESTKTLQNNLKKFVKKIEAEQKQ